MNSTENTDPTLSINVIQEQATVQKEVVIKGKVRIVKTVHEEDETVTIPIASEEVKIEKIPVNMLVENAPPIRYEGDTMIISVIKEVVVVEKKLLLVEEVHVTKNTIQIQDTRTIPLRKEQITIERISSENNKI